MPGIERFSDIWQGNDRQEDIFLSCEVNITYVGQNRTTQWYYNGIIIKMVYNNGIWWD